MAHGRQEGCFAAQAASNRCAAGRPTTLPKVPAEKREDLAGESGFYMPGSHEIVRVIFKNNILTDFFQPPVNQQAVFGGTGPIRPAPAQVDTDCIAANPG